MSDFSQPNDEPQQLGQLTSSPRSGSETGRLAKCNMAFHVQRWIHDKISRRSDRFFPGLWAELWEDSSSRIVEDSSKNSWIRTQTEMSCKKCNLLIWKRTYFYTALLECGTVTWWKEWSIVVHMTWWSRLPTHMIHVSSGTSTLSWRQIAMFLVGGLYDAHTTATRSTGSW